MPRYIIKIISDYLDSRELIFDTTKGQRRRRLTSGVAQGSALGPDLWNVVYDGILSMELPENTKLVGFADDIAAIVTARYEDQARRRIVQVTRRASDWLIEHGLRLAANKTEMVVLTRQRKFAEPFTVEVDGERIKSVKVLRYLGIKLDAKLTYWAHIQGASDKAATMAAKLSRLMPNVAGPRSSKRRILMSVVHSILLYGAEIWADALEVERNRKKMASVQRRSALRTASAYRTVSEAAVLVVAGVIPIDLLAKERKRVYVRKQGEETSSIREEERQRTLREWEQRLQQAAAGRWTAQLIGGLIPWTSREHGEVNFYLTQLLTGHGMFNAYLYRCNRKTSLYCDYCPEEEDDVRHTFFVCKRWSASRTTLEEAVGPTLAVENIVTLMLQSQANWEAVAQYAESVIRNKKREEQERERAEVYP